jgi:hypothetical protein
MICTVKDFVMFGFNFPHNFIEKAFKNSGDLMIQHLKNKFDEAYDRAGSRGAMNTFYAQLDSNNQSILESYVAEYYS